MDGVTLSVTQAVRVEAPFSFYQLKKSVLEGLELLSLYVFAHSWDQQRRTNVKISTSGM